MAIRNRYLKSTGQADVKEPDEDEYADDENDDESIGAGQTVHTSVIDGMIYGRYYYNKQRSGQCRSRTNTARSA